MLALKSPFLVAEHASGKGQGPAWTQVFSPPNLRSWLHATESESVVLNQQSEAYPNAHRKIIGDDFLITGTEGTKAKGQQRQRGIKEKSW